MNTNTPRSFAGAHFAVAGFIALIAAAGCATLPPNKPGVGEHHQHIPGIEAQSPTRATATEALARLHEGNARFASGKSGGTSVVAGRSLVAVKQSGTEGQQPFAAVLTCADSRTPPELLFDQGVGDIFVVRVAGNVTDVMGLASLEYAEDHLGVPLIVVLGHSRCGAVDAAVGASNPPGSPEAHDHAGAGDHYVPSNVGDLVAAIAPAVAKARAAGANPLLPAAVRENVLQTIAQLSSRSAFLAREIAAGDVKVVGAIYHVEDGTIEWLPAATSSGPS